MALSQLSPAVPLRGGTHSPSGGSLWGLPGWDRPKTGQGRVWALEEPGGVPAVAAAACSHHWDKWRGWGHHAGQSSPVAAPGPRGDLSQDPPPGADGETEARRFSEDTAGTEPGATARCPFCPLPAKRHPGQSPPTPLGCSCPLPAIPGAGIWVNPERHQLNPGDIRDSTGRVGAAIPTGTGDSVGLGGWRGEVTLFDTVCFVGFFFGGRRWGDVLRARLLAGYRIVLPLQARVRLERGRARSVSTGQIVQAAQQRRPETQRPPRQPRRRRG